MGKFVLGSDNRGYYRSAFCLSLFPDWYGAGGDDCASDAL